MAETRTLLVVGARERSLGWNVAQQAKDSGRRVTTVGISGQEDIEFNIADPLQVHNLLMNGLHFDDVVCTAGVNMSDGLLDELAYDAWLGEFKINALGPLMLLRQWLLAAAKDGTETAGRHYVAISSNSAHVARSKSGGYCASKAALSMGIRCAAREFAHTGVSVYAYEPAWIRGTPMSDHVKRRLKEGVDVHRIPDNRLVDPRELAGMIVSNLTGKRSPLNGTTIRIDGGEQ